MPLARRLALLVTASVFAGACSGGEAAVRSPVPDAADTSEPAGADAQLAPDEAAPTTPAPPSSTPATTGTTAPPPPPTTAIPPVVEGGFAAVDTIVSTFVAENGLNGAGLVVVDREDGIVHQDYWGEFSADRVSLVASSSKMITAGVLMKLHDDGLLAIDDPVADTVDWAVGHNPQITNAQLVSNSSGLPGLFSPAASTAHLCQFLAGSELEECGAAAFSTPDDDADTVPPDTEFRYGGVQWQIAGAVAETVSGKSWEQLIDEIYVRPCGVDSLGYTNHWLDAGGFDYPVGFDPAALAPTDNPHMEGGAYITPPDYAALLLMHLRGGECPNGQVMSAEAIGYMHEDRVLDAYGDAGASQVGYGMGWWVDRDTGQISDGGAYGSVPWLDLDDGYGAYLVIEADSGLGDQLARLLNPVIHAAMTGDA